MFFFSPMYELLLSVSLKLSANGEEDGRSAECSASAGNAEGGFHLLPLQEEV